MIYTSYFAMLRKIEKYNQDINSEYYIPISICGKVPEWYKGLQYKKVAPKIGFFKEWKENHDNDFYIKHYKEEILDNLNILNILDDIYEIIPEKYKNHFEISNHPWWNDQTVHIVLLCYEKPEDFCHRHLLANWMNKELDVLDIKELRF